jgi:hypothetical protein
MTMLPGSLYGRNDKGNFFKKRTCQSGNHRENVILPSIREKEGKLKSNMIHSMVRGLQVIVQP